MHSPMKHAKKTRKNTFSQIAVAQTEVGDFQGGYFVMPDATSSKENDCPHRTRAPNTRNANIERSPARRKQQTNDSTSSPHKERNQRFEYDAIKKPFADMSLDIKKESSRDELATPQGSFIASPKKSAPASPKHQHVDYSDQKYTSCKDVLSTSPSSSSGRWAGPAFGNAPHPSSLPLPEFPPMWNSSSATPSPAVSAPSHFMTQDSYLSASPTGTPYHGMVYHPHPSFPMSSSPPPTSSIPVVPFPYVGVAPLPPMPLPSLAQLSTDLRRMLNIAGPVPIMSDPIMVSANSA